MAKKYWDGEYSINTDWGGDESTGNLPLPGSAVQKVIKDKLAELNGKVGYIYENTSEGKVYFAATKDDYEAGKYMGVVNSTPRYAMDVMFDTNNKTIFLSNDGEKKIVWYFKTKDLADNGSLYGEDVSVEYEINNTTESKTSKFSTIISSNAESNNNDYTKVELNLDEYLSNGVSELSINVRGLKTKQEDSLKVKITIITLEMEDNTNFKSPFKDYFRITADIKCTKHQRYFIEYRFNSINPKDTSDFITYDKKETLGTGNRENGLNFEILFPEGLKDGKHVFEYRLGIKIDGSDTYYTKIQRIEFIKGENVQFDEPQVLLFSTYSINEDSITENGDLIINGVSQYITYKLKYAIYNSNSTSSNVVFHDLSNDEKTDPKSVANNEFSEYNFQTINYGLRKFSIITTNTDNVNESNRYFYLNIGMSSLNIGVYNTNLRIDFSSVGKSNDSSAKNTWISNVDGIYLNSATFNNEFDWSQGWTDNGIVISNGSEIEFDYAPFPKNTTDSSIYNVGGLNAYSFEIEFMTQNVTDENAVVCDMIDEINGKCGLVITGSEIKFTTPNGESVSTRFKSDEMNRATIVIKPSKDENGDFDKGLVELYVNGILSNITKYTAGEIFEVTKLGDKGTISKNLTFKGVEGADIVVKYIRAYNGAVDGDSIVNNYIIYRTNSKEMLQLYNKNNVINDEGVITPEKIMELGNIPMIIFIGRTIEEELATGDGNDGDGDGNCNEEYKPGVKNANSENWYQTLENTTDKKKNIDMDVIYYNPLDKSKNFKFVKAYITPQGTSSMYYPKKNYRIYTQKNKDTRCFFSNQEHGSLEYNDMIRSDFGEREEDRKWEKWRGTKNYKKRKYSFKNNAQAVKCWCLKADFAETSSSHNTGVARLWGDTLRKANITLKEKKYSVFKTNAQATTEKIYNNNINGDMPDIRTTIDGFPIVVFGKKSYNGEDDKMVFLGQYNFNNDKSTESVFGFCDIDDEEKITSVGKNTITGEESEVQHTLDNMLDKYMCCVETLDNGNALANFSTLDNFDEEWDSAFEFRYMEIPEEPDPKDYQDDHGNWVDGGYEKYQEELDAYNKDIIVWNNTRLKPFKHFAEWVYSTRWCDVNGKKLPEISEEEAERRRIKFETEKWEHLDVWKMAAYYVYVMRFGAVDQVVKNSMLTSEGPFASDRNGNKVGYWDTTPEDDAEYGKYYKWYYINYDNDTVMGVKNDGSLAYGPEITRRTMEGSGSTASYVYAGSMSTLWNNLDADEKFQEIVRIADQGLSEAMPYSTAIKMFDEEQVGQWCERIYNKDAEYKYISPYMGDWYYTGSDDKAENFVDKLFMLQGSRTAHRRWWLSKRFSLFDGKWNSGEFPTRFVEVKCDYASIGDTFSAVAGANAYFGYQINNKTFKVDEGESPWMGGETFEFKNNSVIDWKLYKNIQIGDPIAIFGSTDMVELNLMGLSTNLSSVSFRFGNNADISNKLERLYLSIPDDLLFSEASYDIYSDDEKGTVNGLTGFEKLQKDYPEINIIDFENGTYPTTNDNIDATAPDSPRFYRIPIEVDNNGKVSIIYVYFAKVTKSIRNYSCKTLSFNNLDKLQDLKMAGYMGVNNIDLSNNKFINSVDTRYSNVGTITFAEGARVKEVKASNALTNISFNRCNNIKLSNIIIDSIPLQNNFGININKINVNNSDGLNHDNEFKDFIIKWMTGGEGFKENYTRSISLKGINWKNMNIQEIKTILAFIESAGEDSCELSGVISMGANNLSRDDFDLIENVFRNKKKIDVTVKYPYPNILINIPSSIVAGEEIILDSEIYSDINISDDNYSIEYSFIKETDDENAENSIFDSKTGKRFIKISESEIRNNTVDIINSNEVNATLKTNEVIIGEDTNTTLAVFFGYEGTTKFDYVSLEIKDPTYVTGATINGISLLNETGTTFEYNLILTSNKNEEPIGSYEINWSILGDGLEFITSSISEDNKTLYIHTNEVLPDEVRLTADLKIEALIENGDFANNFVKNVKVERDILVLNENIILTNTTNKVVMDVCYDMGWSNGRSDVLTKEQAANIESIGTAFSNLNKIDWSFDEFKYFIGLSDLSDNAFANSNLTSINIPNNITLLGKGVFEGCKKLTKIELPQNIKILTERSFLNCSMLIDITLPDSITTIEKQALGGVGIKRIALKENKVNGVKSLYLSDLTKLNTIANNAFEKTEWSNNGTTNILEEVYLPKSLNLEDTKYNFLLSPYLNKIILNKQEEIKLFEDNVLYANQNKTILVRTLSESENLLDLLDFQTITRVYDYAFYKCNCVKKVIFNESLDGSGLGKGVFYGSNIEEVDLSNCKKIRKIYDYTFYNMPSLISVQLPVNGLLNEMGTQMFYNSENLETIILPDTVNVLGDNKTDTYFINNCGIKTFKLPKNLITTSMNIINNCRKLSSFIFSNYYNTSTNRLVHNCQALKQIFLPVYSMTVKENNTWFVFENNRLKSGPFKTENDATIEMNNYKNLGLTNNFSVINKNVNDVIIVNNELFAKGQYEAFVNCPKIDKFILNELDDNKIMLSEDEGKSIIRIANVENDILVPCNKTLVKVIYSMTQYNVDENIKHIESAAFSDCNILTSITLTNNIETIGDYAFARSAIKELILPEKVSIIKQYMCVSCEQLNKVLVLARNLESIDSFAFNGCKLLSEIIFLNIDAPKLIVGAEKYDSIEKLPEPLAYKFHPFGYNKYSIVGTNVPKDVIKKLYVPYNSNGYDAETWLVPLLMPQHCNFICDYIPINNDIYIEGDVLSGMDAVYVKKENSENVYTLYPSENRFCLNSNLIDDNIIYVNEIISIFSDSGCTNLIGEFKTEYNKDNYILNIDVNLLGANLMDSTEVEMANITKVEYEMLLNKVNQLMKLLNKKK